MPNPNAGELIQTEISTLDTELLDLQAIPVKILFMVIGPLAKQNLKLYAMDW